MAAVGIESRASYPEFRGPDIPTERIRGLLRYCPIPKKAERTLLKRQIDVHDQSNLRVALIESQTLVRTRKKLAGIGLELTDYPAILDALRQRDVVTLSVIAREADEKIAFQKENVKSTMSEYTVGFDEDKRRVYSAEREQLHNEIIDEIFDGKTPSEKPKLLVLAGPAGSGKSRVRQDFVDLNGDTIFADPDEIRHHLLDGFDPQNNAHVQATYQESYDIADKIFLRAVAKGFNIIHEGTLRSLIGYGNGIGATRAIGACLNSEFPYTVEATYVISRLEDCFIRAIRNRDRGVPLSVLLHTAEGFQNFVELMGHPDISQIEIVDNTQDGKNCHKPIDKSALTHWTKYFSSFVMN